MNYVFEQELIALVRERECLWLPEHRHYHRKDLKEKAFAEIAAALGNGRFTGKFATYTLRTVFQRQNACALCCSSPQ